MPVPKPKKRENQADFISRCIKDLSKKDPERPQKQIIAMCYSQWRNKNK
ncbi:MAG: hypothetical protein KBH94_04995 [Caldisericia bacterium]|nr:hypothetical protein [Caldisericia bacterium]HPZ74861.1 hypothetical protein [Candidatus Pacearchaeota archaeon]